MTTKPKLKYTAFRVPQVHAKKLAQVSNVIGLAQSKLVAFILKGFLKGYITDDSLSHCGQANLNSGSNTT